MTWKDRRRDTNVGVDLSEGVVEVTTTERRTYEDLLNEDDELRLWEDTAGWSGFLFEGGSWFRVNYLKTDDEFIEKAPVDQIDVAESIEDHVNDPGAGAVGMFVAPASPEPRKPLRHDGGVRR